MADPHTPVLLREAVAALNISSRGTYLDATYGRGGHSSAIAARLAPEGRLFVVDRDPDAVDHARDRFRADSRITVIHAPFSRCLDDIGDDLKFDGVIADLGVSSPQLERPERGFGFGQDGPLDMRMDPSAGTSAEDWLAGAEESQIRRVIRRLGEEKKAAAIARAIVERRRAAPLKSTVELARLISEVKPRHEPGRHPATRTFQAIRMHINDELGQLKAFLTKIVPRLQTAARLVVISFHSLEDRMVKRFMRDESRGDPFPSELPVTESQLEPSLRVIGKPLRPSAREIETNRRARSAVMRVAERTGVDWHG